MSRLLPLLPSISGAKLTGRLFTNGAPRDHVRFPKMSAYVTQVPQSTNPPPPPYSTVHPSPEADGVLSVACLFCLTG